MRVATWNIHRGRGAFAPYRPALIPPVIAAIAPDLIALQEAQHWMAHRVRILDEAALDAAGLRVLPVPGHGQGYRANVLLARTDARVLRGPVGVRLGGLEPRGAVMADLDLGEGPFRVVAAHLSLGAGTRRRQAELLLDALGEWPRLPALILGDLNERDPTRGALAVLAPRTGAPPRVPTYPSFRPALALDRILSLPPGLVGDVMAHDTPEARQASDHLPLVARVSLSPPRE